MPCSFWLQKSFFHTMLFYVDSVGIEPVEPAPLEKLRPAASAFKVQYSKNKPQAACRSARRNHIGMIRMLARNEVLIVMVEG